MRSKSKVPSKVRHSRPRVEELELRLAPAVFAILASDLNQKLGAAINTVVGKFSQESAALPSRWPTSRPG